MFLVASEEDSLPSLVVCLPKEAFLAILQTRMPRGVGYVLQGSFLEGKTNKEPRFLRSERFLFSNFSAPGRSQKGGLSLRYVRYERTARTPAAKCENVHVPNKYFMSICYCMSICSV